MDSSYVDKGLLKTRRHNKGGHNSPWLWLVGALGARLITSVAAALLFGLLTAGQLQQAGLIELGVLGLNAVAVGLIRAKSRPLWPALRAVLTDTRYMIRLALGVTAATFMLDVLVVAGLDMDIVGVLLVRVLVLGSGLAIVLSRVRRTGGFRWPELTAPARVADALAPVLGLCSPLLARRRQLPSGVAGNTAPVVMIAYFYPPHNEIGAARPYRFTRYLRRHGVEISVVCSSALLRRGTDKSLLDQVDAADHPPIRVPGPVLRAGPRRMSVILNRLQRVLMPYDDRLGWLPHAYVEASRALTAQSVLVSTHPPVVTHLVALLLKLRTGRPWVADFRDPLWGNPSRTALRTLWLDPVIERLVLRFADAVIANTDAVAIVLRRRYPDAAGKVHTIWNGFDPNDVIEPVLPKRGDRLVVSHVGTLYGARTPVPFAACLQRLIHQSALQPGAVQFRQIGRTDPQCFDPRHPALLELVMLGCFHQSNRHLAHAEARQEMTGADILLLLDLNDTNPGLQVPAKLFEYILVGRPILALTIPGSSTERVLRQSGVPHACVDIGLPAPAFDAAVLAFLTAEHGPTVPSAQFLQQFSMAEQVKTLMAILKLVSAPADSSPALRDMALADTGAQRSVKLPAPKPADPAALAQDARSRAEPPAPRQRPAA